MNSLREKGVRPNKSGLLTWGRGVDEGGGKGFDCEAERKTEGRQIDQVDAPQTFFFFAAKKKISKNEACHASLFGEVRTCQISPGPCGAD
jgi:hypothetical protein